MFKNTKDFIQHRFDQLFGLRRRCDSLSISGGINTGTHSLAHHFNHAIADTTCAKYSAAGLSSHIQAVYARTHAFIYFHAAHAIFSANSDFELFNGLEASPDIVHYEYEDAYPRSLIPRLAAGGRPVEVFHGLPASYMNLKAAYKLQGFSRYHDIEVMRAAGVRPLDCWWAGVVRDRDLFDYAARQLPPGPFVQFIITMSMHLPEYVDLVTPELRFRSSPRSAFLTLAHDTDAALRRYVEKLPQGTMLILWGDHRSYSRDNSGLIPFLVHTKGSSLHFDGRQLPVLSRCSMYSYLQKIFGKDADAPS